MPDGNYWDAMTRGRVNRRRLLGAAGVGVASAAFLAACGGSDSGGGGASSGGDKSSLVTKPSDTTSQAKAGGTLKHYATGDTLHFDSLSSNSAAVVGNASIYAYARLLKFKTGKTPGRSRRQRRWAKWPSPTRFPPTSSPSR